MHDPPHKSPGKQFAICQHQRIGNVSCGSSGSKHLIEYFKNECQLRDIGIELVQIDCFGHCDRGPVGRWLPAGEFLHHLDRAAIDRLLRGLSDGV